MQLIYMTAPSKEEALKITRALVEENLLACANIIDQVTSVYQWQGKVNEEAEVVVIGKTGDGCVSRLVTRVKQLHSYECPCVVSLKVEEGNEDFIRWVDSHAA